jgi:predicted extracellular nuclease
MKKLLGTDLTGSYAFNPGSKTITFSGLGQSIDLQNILLITNTTANTIIYNFADSTSGAVSFTNNVLTLDYDTTSMSSTDKLQIYVDVPAYEESLHDLLRRMNKLLESSAVVDSQQRQKITIDAITASATTQTTLSGALPISVAFLPASASTVSIGAGNNSAGNPYINATVLVGQPILEAPVSQLWRVLEDSRISYGSAIRPYLVFS